MLVSESQAQHGPISVNIKTCGHAAAAHSECEQHSTHRQHAALEDIMQHLGIPCTSTQPENAE